MIRLPEHLERADWGHRQTWYLDDMAIILLERLIEAEDRQSTLHNGLVELPPKLVDEYLAYSQDAERARRDFCEYLAFVNPIHTGLPWGRPSCGFGIQAVWVWAIRHYVNRWHMPDGAFSQFTLQTLADHEMLQFTHEIHTCYVHWTRDRAVLRQETR